MGGGYSKGRYETESWSEGIIKEFVRGGLQFYNLTSYVFQVSSSKLNISTMSVNSLPLASGYAQKLMGKFLSLQGLQERRDRVHGHRGQRVSLLAVSCSDKIIRGYYIGFMNHFMYH